MDNLNSKLARLYVEEFISRAHTLGYVSDSLWYEARKACEIKKESHTISYMHLCLLIKYIDLRLLNQYRKFPEKEWNHAKRQILKGDYLGGTVKKINTFLKNEIKQKSPVNGRQFSAYLFNNHGISVSQATLYRMAKKYDLTYSFDKQMSKADIRQWLDVFRIRKQKNSTQEPAVVPVTELESTISMLLGKRVSERTIYRWSKKYKLPYSRTKKLSQLEVDQWISTLNSVAK